MTADPIQALIDQARLNAQRDLEAAEKQKQEKRRVAKDLVASIYEDAAEIALSGIEQGLDGAACYGISSALKLHAMIVRGDTSG